MRLKEWGLLMMENSLEQLMMAMAMIENVNSELNTVPEAEKAQYMIDDAMYGLHNALDELEDICL